MVAARNFLMRPFSGLSGRDGRTSCVDIFHCSQRRFWQPEFEGLDLNFAGWTKKLTGKATITVGSAGLSGEFIAAFQGESSHPSYGVVSGRMPTADRRIPMSDGAGVVEVVGEGVTEFKIGDHVVSCFFPGGLKGPPTVSDFSTTPGDE
jgi:hypothetical protein